MSRRTRRARLRRLTQGDRPYIFGLVALLLLIVVMGIGPLQSFTAAAERVDSLAATRDRLQVEVDALQERSQRLEDPDEVEVLAREQLGLVKPGEIPYVVITPEPKLDKVGPDAAGRAADVPWYRRLLEALGELLEQAPSGSA